MQGLLKGHDNQLQHSKAGNSSRPDVPAVADVTDAMPDTSSADIGNATMPCKLVSANSSMADTSVHSNGRPLAAAAQLPPSWH